MLQILPHERVPGWSEVESAGLADGPSGARWDEVTFILKRWSWSWYIRAGCGMVWPTSEDYDRCNVVFLQLCRLQATPSWYLRLWWGDMLWGCAPGRRSVRGMGGWGGGFRSLQRHTCKGAVTWGGVVEILSCASGCMAGTSQQLLSAELSDLEKNFPGTTRASPNTISAGKTCSLSLGDIRIPRRTQGSAIKTAFKVRWVRSTIPLATGWCDGWSFPSILPKTSIVEIWRQTLGRRWCHLERQRGWPIHTREFMRSLERWHVAWE